MKPESIPNETRMKAWWSTDPKKRFKSEDLGQIYRIGSGTTNHYIDMNNNGNEATFNWTRPLHHEESTIIQVEDNGMGISNDMIGDIFVPFYTTKENGSGIGLSLSKQIMQNHNGTFFVNAVLE